MLKALPAHASVVVIGGGIMGCSTLYHLAKASVSDALLLERNQLTSGTTWHSAAQVRALRSTRNLTDLIRYSIDLYSRLETETGQSTGWLNKGSISIATGEDRLIHIKRQAALAQMFGLRAESISAAEAKERWPHMNSQDVIGAIWSPDDGRVSPSDLCAALVKGAQSNGALIYENTTVIGIVTEQNRVKAVETNQGAVRCDAIAVCAGLWSRAVGHLAGAEVPVWPCEHFYLLTKPIPGIVGNLPTLSDHDSHLYIRDDSGGLLVGCFEPQGKSIDPRQLGSDFAFRLLDEDWDHFEPMMINALHRLPVLQSAEVKMLLNGPESFTPDGMFLLGECAETKGLYLGCGMNSVGVATSGGAGMALAHCIQQGHLPFDLSEAESMRFPAIFNSIEFLSARVPEVLGKHYEITYPARQWSSGRNQRTLVLHQKFIDEKAYFAQMFGWERPLYFDCRDEPKLTFGKPDWFDNVADEVHSAHEHAALFDQSAFGKIDVTGKDSCRYLNRICVSQVDRPVGQVIYTTMLNERGGIVSDLTVVRLARDFFRLYVGTTAVRKNWTWLHRQLRDEEVQLIDVTDRYCVLGLMGPQATKIASASGADFSDLKYFQSQPSMIGGCPILATRLSYVGEFGWEMTCQVEHAETIYSILREGGAKPAGLLAQTSMRIEKRFLAYGHELDSEVSPLAVGLEFTIDWEKEFIGQQALELLRESGVRNGIVTVIFDDFEVVPLGDEPVERHGKLIGKTTSAAFGFRINAPIALVRVTENKFSLKDGTRVEVNIAGEYWSGRVIHGVAFDPSGLRMKSSPSSLQ